MKALTIFPLLVAFASKTTAFWRMPCQSSPGSVRVDPIYSPGGLSGHSHVIFGSAAVDFNTTFEQQRAACGTCAVNEDKSAYW
jgi:hypothetical protein